MENNQYLSYVHEEIDITRPLMTRDGTPVEIVGRWVYGDQPSVIVGEIHGEQYTWRLNGSFEFSGKVCNSDLVYVQMEYDKDRKLALCNTFSFEVRITGIKDGVADIQDGIRDQLPYAFVAEDARIFRLKSVEQCAPVVQVVAQSAVEAEEQLCLLISHSFLTVENGGMFNFDKPRKLPETQIPGTEQ